MKQILIVVLMCLAFGVKAQEDLPVKDTSKTYTIDGFTGTLTLGGYQNKEIISTVSYTKWEVKNKGVRSCHHDWIYAPYRELNPDSWITTAQYCVPKCDDTELQGRICSGCLRHETRTKTTKYSYDQTESEYSRLVKKIIRNK